MNFAQKMCIPKFNMDSTKGNLWDPSSISGVVYETPKKVTLDERYLNAFEVMGRFHIFEKLGPGFLE